MINITLSYLYFYKFLTLKRHINHGFVSLPIILFIMKKLKFQTYWCLHYKKPLIRAKNEFQYVKHVKR